MTGMQLTSIFCLVDDFCNKILPEMRRNLISDGSVVYEPELNVYLSQKLFFLKFLTEKSSQKTDVYYIDSIFLGSV